MLNGIWGEASVGAAYMIGISGRCGLYDDEDEERGGVCEGDECDTGGYCGQEINGCGRGCVLF